MVECKCPMCKKLHHVNMITTSSARPWVYCKGCRQKASSLPDRSGSISNGASTQTSGHFD